MTNEEIRNISTSIDHAMNLARKDETESVMVWAVNNGWKFDNDNLVWTNGKTTFNFEQLYTTYQAFNFFKY